MVLVEMTVLSLNRCCQRRAGISEALASSCPASMGDFRFIVGLQDVAHHLGLLLPGSNPSK